MQANHELLIQTRARRHRRRRRRIILRRCLMICALFLILAFTVLHLLPYPVSEDTYSLPARGQSALSLPPLPEPAAASLDLSGLYSPHAVLMDLSTGEILAEQEGEQTIYPASLTKIMTALLAIEYTDDLDQSILLADELFYDLYMEDASLAGFEPGEEATLRSLIYGILLPSGAECCLAFADYVCGSETAFVDLMNQKANELGMEDTHFTNCTGLPDSSHYSTAKDIALLLRYALQNETFRAAFTAHSYYVEPTWAHPEGFTFSSTLFETMEAFGLEEDMILGGKTGYTEAAGLCLASLGAVDGQSYILVTAGAAGSHDTEPYHVLDAEWVYRQLEESENK